MTTHHRELPPLAPPGASDEERARAIEARLIARKGGAPPLEAYRRVYAVRGIDWPGDDEIRRMYPVGEPTP